MIKNKDAVKPYVGMPATDHIGSDSRPMIVTWVSVTGKTVEACKVLHERVSGSEQDGSAEYTYGTDPVGEPRRYTLRKNGRFVPKGSTSGSLGLGYQRRYMDPHF